MERLFFKITMEGLFYNNYYSLQNTVQNLELPWYSKTGWYKIPIKYRYPVIRNLIIPITSRIEMPNSILTSATSAARLLHRKGLLTDTWSLTTTRGPLPATFVRSVSSTEAFWRVTRNFIWKTPFLGVKYAEWSLGM